MPLQATSGAASYDGFGGGVAAVPNYIEDVFSTYLYTGTGSAQTITNGIDLSGKGGLVWIKRRDASGDNSLTVTGNGFNLSSNLTTDFINEGEPLFNSSGFNLVYGTSYINALGGTYASWTFRKQKKFFDIVTYTGSGANRTIAHNLGSEPACIIIKSTNRNSTDWAVYHRSLGNTQYIRLNNTGAAATSSTYWNNTTPTSTVFSLGTNADVNNSGGANYVAYLFAHDAGGFGLTGTDNVISCGSFTTDGSGEATVNLGYEPQWLMTKRTDATSGWIILDNMRQWVNGGDDKYFIANGANAEFTFDIGNPTATGFFTTAYAASAAHIYIAIRRGPMKVPTVGTSIFNTLAHTGDAGGVEVTGVGFAPDLFISKCRQSQEGVFLDRLRGTGRTLFSNGTSAEDDNSFYIGALGQDGVKTTTAQNAIYNRTGFTNAWWFMKRAPSFFDEVCYTGVNSGDLTLNHNLSVPYEMLIIKRRSGIGTWFVLHSGLTDATKYIRLNTVTGELNAGVTVRDSTNTTFLAPAGLDVTVASSTYVAWLFATCAGVSKVGSYTGNGTTQTINCGFGAGGARFVLLKRIDDTGGWYVYDTARGMTVLTDPYLFLNNNAGEVATLGSVTTVSTGFALDSTILADINISSGNYIFLAIA